MDVAWEAMKFDYDGNVVYQLWIKDFLGKMESWDIRRYIDCKPFKVQDVELFLRVFPNGGDRCKRGGKLEPGHMLVCIMNNNRNHKKQFFMKYEVLIGNGTLPSDFLSKERVYSIFEMEMLD